MKTSNKIFLATLVLLLGSLTAYNMALRAEQRTGNYKDPLHSYNAMAFSNFDEISVLSASGINVKIEAGPFGVHVAKNAAEYVRITQQGQQLSVSLAFPKESKWLGAADAVVISCPRLRALTTDGIYTAAGKTVREKMGQNCDIVVKGFTQDSLSLRQDRASQVKLEGNTLGWLRAVAGTSPGSGSGLQIGQDNRIQAADLAIGCQGHLNLATGITSLRQQFSDSASVTFSGAAARRLSAR